jgi:hypothetical protein
MLIFFFSLPINLEFGYHKVTILYIQIENLKKNVRILQHITI